jgi:hypothetical protein
VSASNLRRDVASRCFLKFDADMQYTPEQLFGALYEVGTEDGDEVPADIIDRLIAFKMVERGEDGKPMLTHYGYRCFVVIESGDGIITEFQ